MRARCASDRIRAAASVLSRAFAGPVVITLLKLSAWAVRALQARALAVTGDQAAAPANRPGRSSWPTRRATSGVRLRRAARGCPARAGGYGPQGRAARRPAGVPRLPRSRPADMRARQPETWTGCGGRTAIPGLTEPLTACEIQRGQAESVRLGRRHLPRQVAHIRPATGYAHNRAMCAHSISSSARDITEQIRQFGSWLAAQRPGNLVSLCDGRRAALVTASGRSGCPQHPCSAPPLACLRTVLTVGGWGDRRGGIEYVR